MNKNQVLEAFKTGIENISKPYINKASQILLTELKDSVKDNYLADHYQELSAMILSVFCNDSLSWFSMKWTFEFDKSKEANESLVFNDGRMFGILQGISVALSHQLNVNDYFINPRQADYGKNYLSNALNRVFNKCIDIYEIFADMLDKEMIKQGVSAKDLSKVFTTSNKHC